MIGVVLAIFTSFGLLVFFSLRKARRLSEEGRGYAPEGRLRWESHEV